MRVHPLNLFACAILLWFSRLGAAGPAEQPGSLVERLRQRDDAIQTSKILVRRGIISGVKSNPQRIINKFATAKPSRESVTQLINEIGPLAQPAWIGYETVQKGNMFKTITTYPDQSKTIEIYDGAQFIVLRPSQANQQIDIYSEPPRVVRYGLRDLNLKLDRLLSQPVVSSEADGDDTAITFAGADGYHIKLWITPALAVRHLTTTQGKKITTEKWLLNLRSVDGFVVPDLVIIHRPDPEGLHQVDVILIEALVFNMPLEENDVTSVQVPSKATRVDHRYNPPVVDVYLAAAGPSPQTLSAASKVLTPPAHPASAQPASSGAAPSAALLAGTTDPRRFWGIVFIVVVPMLVLALGALYWRLRARRIRTP